MTDSADSSDWRRKPSAANSSTYSTGAADHRPAGSSALCAPAELLELSVQHYPAVGICVLVVAGELDLLTVPLLEQRLREQLVAEPAHLILDLESVRFLGCSGLSCLLDARELAGASGSQLHLAGLITRVIARAVGITGLVGLFSTYPTLIHAVVELADRAEVTASDRVTSEVVLTAIWCRSVGLTWTLELREFAPDSRPGALVDWISSGVPVTQPVPDTLASELLAGRGLWLFRDVLPGPPTGSRHRVGYVSAEAELITLAHRVREDAAQAGVHPVLLAAWQLAGFSTAAAAGWIRAGCLFPK
jgi:anti-sigma B factor antagonist